MNYIKNTNETFKLHTAQQRLINLVNTLNSQQAEIQSIRPFLNGYQTTITTPLYNLLVKNHRLSYAKEGHYEITVLDKRTNTPIYDTPLHDYFSTIDIIPDITLNKLKRIITTMCTNNININTHSQHTYQNVG